MFKVQKYILIGEWTTLCHRYFLITNWESAWFCPWSCSNLPLISPCIWGVGAHPDKLGSMVFEKFQNSISMFSAISIFPRWVVYGSLVWNYCFLLPWIKDIYSDQRSVRCWISSHGGGVCLAVTSSAKVFVIIFSDQQIWDAIIGIELWIYRSWNVLNHQTCGNIVDTWVWLEMSRKLQLMYWG